MLAPSEPPPTSYDALVLLGWDQRLAAALDSCTTTGLLPGRVSRPGRGGHLVIGPEGPVLAVPAPELAAVRDPVAVPTVGDWVAWRPFGAGGVIEAVLPRTSAFIRYAAGVSTRAQVIAANVDVLLIAVALTSSPNLRRLERFLTLGWESGALPVVLLTKSDVCADIRAEAAFVESAAPGVAVHALSAISGEGLDALDAYLDGRSTLALVGSSGVGKSTLVNRIAGADTMATTDIRNDGKGRHTTTHRELIPLDRGGVLIDTPGLRGVQLWDADEGFERAFADVEELAAACRFGDCGHDSEPGCAVTAAIAAGSITGRRLDSYRRLQRELTWLDTRQDARAQAETRRRWRAISKAQRARPAR